MTLNLSLSSDTNDYIEVLLFRVQISHLFSNTDIKYNSIYTACFSFENFHYYCWIISCSVIPYTKRVQEICSR